MAQAQPPFNPPGSPLALDGVIADFSLPAMDGVVHRASDYAGRILVLDFWSAECPISRQYDPYFNGFGVSYGARGVEFLAIDSNWYENEEDITQTIAERRITFPILRDRGAVIADYLNASTTPHIFLFDTEGRLRYRGAVDDRTFENKDVSVNYLEEAVDALLLGGDITVRETEPYGCTIVRAWQ